MRQITTLPEESARRFSDYLATLKIDTHLQADPGGLAVWVRDEDKVPRAREELEQFLRAPTDPRYGRASAAARALRRREETEEEEYRRLQEQAEERFEPSTEEPGPRPATFLIMGLCVLVALATGMGSPTSSLTRRLLIATQPPAGGLGLHEILSGEVWRLFTPALLHFKVEDDPTGLMHIAFNLLLFLSLGGQVESVQGTRRFVLLVLAVAVLSNLVQYYLGGSTFQGLRPSLAGSYNFGGMSGVVYGLLGYVWIKSRTEPELGLQASAGAVVILIGWLLLGPMVDKNIANGAHVGGLAAGALIAAVPTLWRRPPAPEED